MKDVVAKKKIEVINETVQAREKIRRAIEQSGPYTHNIIGMTLSDLAKKVGTKYANELVHEFDLQDLYGIEPESET